MEVDAYRRSEMKQFKKSPNYANILDSWFDEYESNLSFLKSRKLETVYEKKEPFSYQYNELVYIESERSSYDLVETEHAKRMQNCHANEMFMKHFNFAFNNDNSRKQVPIGNITSPGIEIETVNDINLTHDGSKRPIAIDDSYLAHDGKKQIVEDHAIPDEHMSSNQGRLGSKEFVGNEGMEDKKGKPPAQQIKGCACQELTPEQKEANEKPPQCKCKIEKLIKYREKHKECPECDRIKLNANLIRAIQRINELQAQRKLTESDVKIILEEEYHGDIFGYHDKKVKLMKGKKNEEETGQKPIDEREQEMRHDFKEIIENEVTKFEEQKKKKASPKTISSKEKVPAKEIKMPKKKRRKAKKVPLSMEEILKWMYPSHHFGHKDCVTAPRLVPKTMGWLWNSSKNAGSIKPGRGWVPGAIRKDVIEVLKNLGKEKRVVEDEERTVARSSRRSGTSKSGESTKGAVDKYIPTFHMHKKNGYYYFSLYPVKTDELDKVGHEPKPTMFKVSAKQPDPECSEVSTDDESYEIEFVTPSSMKKQIKKPLKKHISQQYLEEDFSVKVKKAAAPEVVEEKEKKRKKEKGRKSKKK